MVDLKIKSSPLSGYKNSFKNRKYCTFNGINQYIACGQATTYSKNLPFTQIFAFKFDSDSSGKYIYSNQQYNGGFSIRNVNNDILTYFADSAGNSFYLRTPAITIDKWHLCIITFDGLGDVTNAKIYIDNVLQNITTGGNPIVGDCNASNNINIGAYWTGNYCFSGALDEVVKINRELSLTDMTRIYGNQNGDFDPTKMRDIAKIAGSDLDMHYHLGDKAKYINNQWIIPNIANPNFPGISQGMTDSNVHQYNDSTNTDYILEFNTNTDNRVEIPSDVVFDNLTAFTISIDFYAYSINGNSISGNCLVSRGISVTGFWLVLGNVNSHFKIGSYNTNYLLSDAINPTLNVWNNMKIVWDGTNATFYYNNVAMGSGTVSNTGLASASSLIYVGGYKNPSPQYFDGKLDNFLMFNRALDTSEFDNIMNITNGLLIKQEFNEGEGLTTADLSGNGHNGTLIGSSIIPKWWKR